MPLVGEFVIGGRTLRRWIKRRMQVKRRKQGVFCCVAGAKLEGLLVFVDGYNSGGLSFLRWCAVA